MAEVDPVVPVGDAKPTALKTSDFEGEKLVEAPVEEAETEEEPVEAIDDGEPAGDGEGEDEPKPKKGKVQERIDELTAARYEAQREADYWRGVAEGKIKPETAETKPEALAQAEPDPETYELGEADPAYLKDMVRYEARKIAEEETGKQELTRQLSELERAYDGRVTAVREELPDYDDKVTKAAARGEWPCPPLIALAIKNSEAGPKIAYHLANNVEEAVALSNLSGIEQAVAFGRLEERFSGSQKKPAKVTSAPELPGNRSRGTGGQYEPSERTLYKKMLNEFR